MGDAKRKAADSFEFSILMPTRGRPDRVVRAVQSIMAGDTLRPEVEIVIGFDEDDPTVEAAVAALAALNLPEKQLLIQMAPRPRTLADLFNQLAAASKGRWLMAFCDDIVMVERDWYEIAIAGLAKAPKGVAVAFPKDPLHPDFPSMPIISRKMFTGLGYMMNPIFPYWFTDSWLNELSIITGLKLPLDFSVNNPEEKGKTHGIVDLAFWWQVFEKTRPMRVKDALLMLKAAFSDSDPWVRTVLATLEQRQNECAKLMARFHNPKWIQQIEDASKGESGPGPHYAEVKAEAVKLTGVLDQATPRAPKVGLAVPSGRTFEAGTATDCMGLSAFCTGHGINLVILNLQSSMISHSRNETVRMALRENVDYIMWIDSDMRFPPDAVMRLLSAQKDIVCATYNKRVPPYETLGKMKGPKPEDADVTGLSGLQEALLMPGGMILIKADVYRSIPQPWYFETYKFDGASGLDRIKSLVRNYFKDAPSDEVLASLDGTDFAKWMNENYLLGEMGEDYDLFSEDLNFCRKARRYGYQIWCDMELTYDVKHLGVLEVECKRPAPKDAGPAYGDDNDI